MDERLIEVERQKQNAINNSNKVYNGLLQDNQTQYDTGNNFLNEQERIQNETLDKQLEFTRQEIDKQKQEANDVYKKESKKALNDYTSFINPYGYQAENLASSGLLNSGVAETTKLGGWNTYQNRLATANKVMQDAVTQFERDFNEARLNNDVQKAQNALAKLQMQKELLDTFYSNKSTISQNQLNNNQNLDSNYYGRYQDVISQINYEKEQAEKARQFNEQMAYQKEQDRIAQMQWEREYALAKSSSARKSSSSGSRSLDLDSGTGKSSGDGYGNSAETMNLKDYYFKSTTGEDYQPRYINDIKLAKTGLTVKDIFGTSSGFKTTKNIWKAGNNYYVWAGNDYYDVTSQYKKATKK